MPTIWIDGDAAPKACKEILLRASERTGLPVVLVANRSQYVPKLRTVSLVQVGKGFDVADEYIAEQCASGDLVITADIPLAAQVVDKGCLVIKPRGDVLDESNVRQKLATRDIMDELRGGGVMMGGPPPYGPKDKQRFANALDRWLAASR